MIYEWSKLPKEINLYDLIQLLERNRIENFKGVDAKKISVHFSGSLDGRASILMEKEMKNVA